MRKVFATTPELNVSYGNEEAPRLCAHENCEEIGSYPAPKSPQQLRNYIWLCLDHAREYNKGWNYEAKRRLPARDCRKTRWRFQGRKRIILQQPASAELRLAARDCRKTRWRFQGRKRIILQQPASAERRLAAELRQAARDCRKTRWRSQGRKRIILQQPASAELRLAADRRLAAELRQAAELRLAASAVWRLAVSVARSLAVRVVRHLPPKFTYLAASAVRRLPPEFAHHLVVKGFELGYVPPLPLLPNTPRLRQNVLGLDFDHPLGLAAGFDKNAEAITGGLSSGFSSVEVGTLTPKPQKGNPKPRLFRLPQDRAIINRWGFPNRGCEDAQARLGQAREMMRRGVMRRGVIGVNIGANKDSLDKREDYAIATRMLARYADYLTVNISSPNTPGLRAMQNAATIKEILAITREAMADTPCPILVKLAPDMSDKDFLAALDASAENGAAGVILTNTTEERPKSLKSKAKGEQGGLSGAPLFYRSTESLLKARRHLGDQIALIGVGGVRDAATAYAKILAGASLVQLYSAWTFEGGRLPAAVLWGLDSRLKDEGIANISEAVGSMDDLSEICRKCQIAEFD